MSLGCTNPDLVNSLVCAIFCEQLLLYSSPSFMSISSSSHMLPVSFSIDWAMLGSLSLLLSRIINFVLVVSLAFSNTWSAAHSSSQAHGCSLVLSGLLQLRPPSPHHGHFIKRHSEIFQVSQHVQSGHAYGHLVPCAEWFLQSFKTALQLFQCADVSIQPISIPCCQARSQRCPPVVLHFSSQLLQETYECAVTVFIGSPLPASTASLPICCALS